MFRSISRSARGTPTFKTVAGFAVAAMVTAAVLGSPAPAEAQVAGKWGGAIDPDALQILKGMTDYLGCL